MILSKQRIILFIFFLLGLAQISLGSHLAVRLGKQPALDFRSFKTFVKNTSQRSPFYHKPDVAAAAIPVVNGQPLLGRAVNAMVVPGTDGASYVVFNVKYTSEMFHDLNQAESFYLVLFKGNALGAEVSTFFTKRKEMMASLEGQQFIHQNLDAACHTSFHCIRVGDMDFVDLKGKAPRKVFIGKIAQVHPVANPQDPFLIYAQTRYSPLSFPQNTPVLDIPYTPVKISKLTEAWESAQVFDTNAMRVGTNGVAFHLPTESSLSLKSGDLIDLKVPSTIPGMTFGANKIHMNCKVLAACNSLIPGQRLFLAESVSYPHVTPGISVPLKYGDQTKVWNPESFTNGPVGSFVQPKAK